MNLGKQITSYSEVKTADDAKKFLEEVGLEVAIQDNWKHATDKKGRDYVGVNIVLKEARDPAEGTSRFINFLTPNKTARVYAMVYKQKGEKGTHAYVNIISYRTKNGKIEMGSVLTFNEDGRALTPQYGSFEFNRLTAALKNKDDHSVSKGGELAQSNTSPTNYYTTCSLIGFLMTEENEASITVEELENPRPRDAAEPSERKVPSKQADETTTSEIVGDKDHEDESESESDDNDQVPL